MRGLTEVNGWGRYPRLQARVRLPQSASRCAQALQSQAPLIAHGLGRSYGDSALAKQVLGMRYLDHFVAFDSESGVLTCEAGVSLDAVLRTFVPLGWFLPVTPGTRFVTVGGAIASDVHGKNHHGAGTFGAQVLRLELLVGSGERVWVSSTEHVDLFQATCGGMGLTGVILHATFALRRITSSQIVQTTIKAPSLQAVLESFDAHASAAYSVAWIDCLASRSSMGRSLLMLGEHANDGPLVVQNRAATPVPFDLPAALLNQTTVQAFNSLYYGLARKSASTRRIAFEPFFYPLDALSEWNRMYGRAGFLQYQFVLPQAAGVAGLSEVLSRIVQSGRGSFLAVLKAFGAANANLLSFPQAGYTLALDFKVEAAVFELLNELDAIVLHHGGRLYLAKDARMSIATFRAGYPNWQSFEAVRERWGAHGKFASNQSRRLGLL
jgi:decaprenylphospho-beta-D-ribofuranose 2-oxidase